MRSDSAPRRGRPPRVDPDAVVRAALELWATRGFAQTGWQDIADATDLSVRTLIRRFGSQPGILAGGVDAAVDRLRAALAAAPETGDAGAVLRAAVAASVSHGDEVRTVGLQLMRVLAEEPALQAWQREAYASWIAALAEAIEARVRGLDADTAYALACGYEAIANATMRAWARGGGADSPADRVEAALAHIALT